MQRLLNLIRLDCQMERFAEVFGDNIEFDDAMAFLKEALKLVPSAEFKGIETSATPEQLFDAIDYSVSLQITKKHGREALGDRNYFLLRAFYRFCNDAYLWEDCQDLERWEEELFDNLENLEQKNYEPLTLEASEFGRELLFLRFADYLLKKLGDPVAWMVLDSVKEWKGEA